MIYLSVSGVPQSMYKITFTSNLGHISEFQLFIELDSSLNEGGTKDMCLIAGGVE